MAYQSQPPQPTGDRWIDWATRLNIYLNRVRTQLQHRSGDESASTDGVILYDPQLDHVAVSRNGIFEPLSWGHNCLGQFYTTATHSAASANTAYAITWENTAYSEDMEVDETVTSRINFARAGTFQIDFSAELLSSNSSSKSIYIWPRINGVDIPFSTIVTSVTNNGVRIVVSRSGIFQMDEGDYLEAMFAVTDTNLTIDGSAATAFSPASPSATLSLTQLR
jgi:hypothetical protein